MLPFTMTRLGLHNFFVGMDEDESLMRLYLPSIWSAENSVCHIERHQKNTHTHRDREVQTHEQHREMDKK